MSVNAEDEAKARLEVAQLYEEMGQIAKAVRYLLNAAEVYKEGGVHHRAREVYQKVLQLEPGNQQAQTELNSMLGVGAAAAPPETPRPAPVSSQPGQPAAAPTASAPGMAPPGAGPNGLLVPTPWVGRDPRYAQAAKSQLTAAPDKFQFGWDPLPKVDSRKVAERTEARKKADEEAERKARPAVESAFGKREGGFTSGGGFMKTASTSGRAAAPPPAAAAEPAAPGRFGAGGGAGVGGGDIRGGNRDLADLITKRLQDKGKK